MGGKIMSIAEELKSQVDDIKAQVAAGTMSSEDGAALLSELNDTYKANGQADAEIAVRYLIAAIQVLSKVA